MIKLYRLKRSDFGYNKEKEMSNNAVKAYNEGKMPLSKITLAELRKFSIPLTLEEFKKAVGTGLIKSSEWHHVGKFFNKINFYDLKEISKETNWKYIEEKIRGKPKIKFIRGIFSYNGKNYKGILNSSTNEVFITELRKNIPFNDIELTKKEREFLA